MLEKAENAWFIHSRSRESNKNVKSSEGSIPTYGCKYLCML